MAYLSEALRQQVIERAHGRCEYCQTQQVVVVSMEIDHIVPESAGGASDLDNLYLACISCNGFKLVVQTLNIYKPRGLTPYGWRKQQEQRMLSQQ